jgi:hypothetical protein
VRAVFAAVVSMLVALVAAAAPAATRTARCGEHTIDGVDVKTFCGPAKAVVRYQGATVQVAGGTCKRSGDSIELEVGTQVRGKTAKSLPVNWFTLTAGTAARAKPARTDGAYTGAIASMQRRGTPVILALGVHGSLAGGRSRGTFAGVGTHDTLLPGGRFSGSFSC